MMYYGLVDVRRTPRGMTLQVPVGDIEAGKRFYTAVFERAPDFAPHDDFLEWQVLDGVELWGRSSAPTARWSHWRPGSGSWSETSKRPHGEPVPTWA